jgi:SRSO17 transposase
MEAALAEIQGWAAELDAVVARIAPRFPRREVRQRVRGFLRGLLGPVERKNGWQLAEQAGDSTPDGMQRLLNHARWDADAVRDEVRAYVVEHLGDGAGVLVVDETGFVKKGTKSAGVQRQYTGTVGKKENCQVGVFMAYASGRGAALVDRELYLPESWTADRARCQQAAIPDQVGFQTKPQLALLMLERALDSGIPVAWVTGDEAYGGDARLRLWLEARQVPHVLAVKRTQHVIAMNLLPTPAEDLIAAVKKDAWQTLSAGAGAKGPRVYDWVAVQIRPLREPGVGHWLLARRSLDDGEVAYYLCYGPAGTTLAELVGIAGTRWTVEVCQPQCTHICGLAA